MRFSYSKIDTFDTCPRMYYYKYIEGLGGEQNFYSQYGSFIHELIDDDNKHNLTKTKLLGRFTNEYKNKITIAPPEERDIDDEYFFGAYDFFEHYEHGIVKGAKILASERKLTIPMFGHEFVGIIDLVVELANSKIAIIDHKSSSRKSFYGKKGDIKYRQLYLYCDIVKEKMGIDVDKLIFNLFRERYLLERDFNKEEHDKVLSWAEDRMNKIVDMHGKYENEIGAWMKFNNHFFCQHVCEARNYCAIDEGEKL